MPHKRWTRWTLLRLLAARAPAMVGWDELLNYGPKEVTYQMVRRLRRDHRVPIHTHRCFGYSVSHNQLGKLLVNSRTPLR